MEKRGWKLVRNNILSLVVVIGILVLGVVFATGVIIKESQVEVEDLTVTGDVGIGTANPDEMLEIEGTLPYIHLDSSGNAVIKIDKGSATKKGDIIFQTAGSNDWYLGTTDSNDVGDGDEFYIGQSRTAPELFIETSGDIGIGTISPTYPLEVVGNVSGVSIWSDGNVSASGYHTRTSIYDKSKGDALNFIKDSDDYLTDGKVDHSKFYGYAGEFESTDYSRPETRQECVIKEDTESGEEKEVCREVTYYPHKKMEKGVSLNSEIDVLRQAVFELKSELCEKDSSYGWC